MKKISLCVILIVSSLPIFSFAQGWNIEMLDTKYTPWHSADAIACQGDYAYVGLDYFSSIYPGGIAVVDKSDLNDLMEIGFTEITDDIRDMEIVGNYLFVCYWGTGLAVVDISNPADPVEIFSDNTIAFINDIYIDGDLAYLGCRYNVFAIVDISDPYNVIFLSQLTLYNDVSIVTASGNTAYTKNGNESMNIIDVTDPANPVYLNSIYVPGNVSDFGVSDGYLFIALYIPVMEGGLFAYDISDPLNPQLVGSNTTYYVIDLIVSENIAYTLTLADQLVMFDVSDPANPTFLGSSTNNDCVNDLTLDGDFIYLAYDSDGLKAIDVSNPANPIEYPSFEPNYELRDVVLVGDYALIADAVMGLLVVDVSNPSNMLQETYLNTFSTYSIDLVGEYAYVSSDSCYQVLAVNDPGDPRVEGQADIAGSICCADAANHRLYVRGANNLSIYDIASSTNPQLLGGYMLPGGAYDDAWFLDIAVEGNLLYAISTYWIWGDGGCVGDSLLVLDISDPANLNFVSMNYLSGSPTQIEVRDNLAYVGGMTPTLKILDVSDPIRPELLGAIDFPGFAERMVLKYDYIYLQLYDDVSIRIINISHPYRPVLTGYYTTPNDPYDFVVGDEIIFVADDEYFESYDVDDAVWVKPVISVDQPSEFYLHPPYPNPFNHSTAISYQLLAFSHVNLTVYDITGREVAKLVDGYQNAGTHEIMFDAKDLVSGVYFVRLEAEEFKQTQKILLLK